MGNTQQIVLMFPLFALAAPGNTQIFFGFLMQIAAFDMLPMDILYDKFIPEIPDSMNSNLEAEGFGTTLVLYNLGSMIIAIVSWPVLCVYLMIVAFFVPICFGKIRKWCSE